MAPASTMPWIELAADISGVCRVAGTLLITSKPTHRLRTKIVMSVSSAVDIGSTSRGRGQGRVHDAAVAGDHHPGLQVVGQVQGQLAVLDQVQHKGADVTGEHRRGRRGKAGR